MIKLIEMDEKVTFSEQREENVGSPVILINKFHVTPEGVEHFLRTWEADATYFKQQPDPFPRSFTAELVAAACSLTMQFGNLMSYIRRPLRTVSSTLSWLSIRLVPSHLLTYLRKLQCMGYA
jgi:hypothetical protein